MFGKFSEQFKKSTKPASTLLEMNAKLLGELASQQTQFFTGVMADSKKLVETVTEQSELKGVLAAQSVYAESVRDRFTSASKGSYGTLTSMREDVSDLVKTSLEDATADAKSAVEDAVSKVAEVSKPAAKPVAKKPAARKPAAKKPAAKAAPAKAAPAEAAPAKAAPAKKAPAAKKPAPAKKAAPAAKKAPAKAAPKPEAPPAVKPKVAEPKTDTPKD